MQIRFSQQLQSDLMTTVMTRGSAITVVDVYATAEDIRKRFEAENIALEDIAAAVARFASQCGFIVEFDDGRCGRASRIQLQPVYSA